MYTKLELEKLIKKNLETTCKENFFIRLSIKRRERRGDKRKIEEIKEIISNEIEEFLKDNCKGQSENSGLNMGSSNFENDYKNKLKLIKEEKYLLRDETENLDVNISYYAFVMAIIALIIDFDAAELSIWSIGIIIFFIFGFLWLSICNYSHCKNRTFVELIISELEDEVQEKILELKENELKKEKAEAEAKAKEKAEAEAKAKEKAEAEAKAKEKAEAEAKAKEKAEAEAKAKEKAEAEAKLQNKRMRSYKRTKRKK